MRLSASGSRLAKSSAAATTYASARIEALSKTTGADVVLSQAIAGELGGRWPALGSFELRGVGEPAEVFALPEDG